MAGGVKIIARALYDRGSKEEKDEAGKLFDALDVNGHGRIFLRDFQRSKVVEPRLLRDSVFKELSSNADGTLSFDDVLVLFYSKKGTIKILRCDECHQLIFGPSFSSYSHNNNRHTICCLCYGRGRGMSPIRSQPSTSTPTPATVKYTKPILNAKAEMKELQEIAKLHYKAASPHVQNQAQRFFYYMDSDGDNKVGIEEFLSFMFNQGYDQLRNRRFFDEDGSGALGFWEVMTLYYIIKSGRPNCDLCKVFIPGVFFTCSECFATGNTYRLCRTCYKHYHFNCHFHNEGTHFLDNYTLLHSIRESSLRRDDDDRIVVEYRQHGVDRPSSSTTTVPASTEFSKMEVAYKALELGIAVSNSVSSLAVTAGNIADFKCTIL